MPRKIEINNKKMLFTDNEIEGFLERVVTPIGTSAKADVPKRYIGRRVYLIITRKKVRLE